MAARGEDDTASATAEMIRTAGRLGQATLDLWANALTRVPPPPADPLRLAEANLALGRSLMRDPARIGHAQLQMWADFIGLSATLLSPAPPPPAAMPAADDRRFRDDAWSDNPLFELLKQSYLLAGRGVLRLIEDAPDLDTSTRQRLSFAAQQVVDALSPTNFAATNPVVIRAALDSGGRSLLRGLENLLEDLNRSGRVEAPMADASRFAVGRDLAVTPGQVVWQNDLMQLIQYDATTPTVHRRPLLVLPPWMNKFYVLDLRPGNSFVQWLQDRGHTVFMVSWVNPGRSLSHKSFEDYMLEGPLAALDAIGKATGEREVNVVGYCLGGILLSATLAWMTARGDDRIRSATLLTTMVDFGDTGEVSVFIDEAGLERLEATIEARGYLDGRAVYDTFRALRANDLIWSFYIDNYLLGNRPAAFDLLYWNSDSTNMPAAMHTWFMRNMYLDNRLREAGGLTLAGEAIDVRQVTTPVYMLATQDDHIAPWHTAYASAGLFSGPVKFVLGESGHIAGVVNPPARQKYGYWTSRARPHDAGAWREGATHHRGSWWPDWERWMRRHTGGRVPAREPGGGGLAAIEAAPGSYVLCRNPE